MTCLETSFLVDILRGNEDVRETLLNLETQQDTLKIAAPSIAELIFGALVKKSVKEKMKINEIVSSFEVLIVDETVAREAAEIEYELHRRGEMIQPEDILIAACAKANGEMLVTRNKGFTKIAGLRVLTY